MTYYFWLGREAEAEHERAAIQEYYDSYKRERLVHLENNQD